jgi:hypothetical protein
MLPLLAGYVLGALLIGASTAKPTPKTEDAVVPGAYMIEFTDDHASFTSPVRKKPGMAERAPRQGAGTPYADWPG